MSSGELVRILCVDDEQNVLDAMQQLMRRHYDLHTADNGEEGLRLLREAGPFAVVLSDMRMPGMNGAEFLRQARDNAPETVRILLTGYADMENIVSAVNDGNIFRILGKPCPADHLLDAVAQAVQQHELLRSERVLLADTLRGTILALTELLSQSDPQVFGRATRLKIQAKRCAEELQMPELWQMEVAAILSQVGTITLPAELRDRLYSGGDIEPGEEQVVMRLPEVNEQILANIPRLESVREILRYQNKLYNGGGYPDDGVAGEDIPLGARILKVMYDFDLLQLHHLEPEEALETMHASAGYYDLHVLNVLTRFVKGRHAENPALAVELAQLKAGMVLAQDILTADGAVLVGHGQEISGEVCEQLQQSDAPFCVVEPLWVHLSAPAADSGDLAGETAESDTPSTLTVLQELPKDERSSLENLFLETLAAIKAEEPSMSPFAAAPQPG
ncbi:MAG: HD domain-containing phosphohydrolase [bacterium]